MPPKRLPSHYHRFTAKARLDKALNTLLGILEGLSIDKEISRAEADQLIAWLKANDELADRHPYNEIAPAVEDALRDGILTTTEHEELVWLIERLRSDEYYGAVTIDMQRLQGIVGAIASDGKITEKELTGLQNWLAEHEHLRTIWPYDELDTLLVAVMADRKIDPAEHRMLLHFFTEFSDMQIEAPAATIPAEQPPIMALCATDPVLRWENAMYCFTGEFAKHTRYELVMMVHTRGGESSDTMNRSVDYLVVGSQGNPCWAYARYGRKIEQAMKLRRQGSRVLLISEIDFLDAIA